MTEDLIVPDWRALKKENGKYEQCTILGWIFCYKRHYWVSCETSMGSLNKGHMGVLCAPVWLFYEIEIISLYKGKKKKKETHTWLHSSCSQHWNHCFLFFVFSSDSCYLPIHDLKICLSMELWKDTEDWNRSLF